MTPDLTLNLGLRYEISEMPLGLFGETDPESLGAMVPGPVEKDTNNWAPRVGFAWNPQTQQLVPRQQRDGASRWLRSGLRRDLLQPAHRQREQLPRLVSLDVTNQQDLYPNRLTGTRSYLQPAARPTRTRPRTRRSRRAGSTA